jgi:hypothetical protein
LLFLIHQRIIPLALADAMFGTWRDRAEHAKHWKKEFSQMKKLLSDLGTADFALYNYKAMQDWRIMPSTSTVGSRRGRVEPRNRPSTRHYDGLEIWNRMPSSALCSAATQTPSGQSLFQGQPLKRFFLLQ